MREIITFIFITYMSILCFGESKILIKFEDNFNQNITIKTFTPIGNFANGFLGHYHDISSDSITFHFNDNRVLFFSFFIKRFNVESSIYLAPNENLLITINAISREIEYSSNYENSHELFNQNNREISKKYVDYFISYSTDSIDRAYKQLRKEHEKLESLLFNEEVLKKYYVKDLFLGLIGSFRRSFTDNENYGNYIDKIFIEFNIPENIASNCSNYGYYKILADRSIFSSNTDLIFNKDISFLRIYANFNNIEDEEERAFMYFTQFLGMVEMQAIYEPDEICDISNYLKKTFNSYLYLYNDFFLNNLIFCN